MSLPQDKVELEKLKELLGEEFVLAVKIGLPNYFDFDAKTGTITPKKKRWRDKR